RVEARVPPRAVRIRLPSPPMVTADPVATRSRLTMRLAHTRPPGNRVQTRDTGHAVAGDVTISETAGGPIARMRRMMPAKTPPMGHHPRSAPPTVMHRFPPTPSMTHALPAPSAIHRLHAVAARQVIRLAAGDPAQMTLVGDMKARRARTTRPGAGGEEAEEERSVGRERAVQLTIGQRWKTHGAWHRLLNPPSQPAGPRPQLPGGWHQVRSTPPRGRVDAGGRSVALAHAWASGDRSGLSSPYSRFLWCWLLQGRWLLPDCLIEQALQVQTRRL